MLTAIEVVAALMVACQVDRRLGAAEERAGRTADRQVQVLNATRRVLFYFFLIYMSTCRFPSI